MIVGIAAVATLLLACSIDFGGSPRDSPVAVAAATIKVVFGHVNDSLQASVPGVGVTVTAKIDSTVHKILTTTTDNSGFYTVTFGASDWFVNDIIQVDVTYDSLSATNSTVANALPSQSVDVQFAEVIPEFSSAFVVTLSTIVLIVAVVRNFRKDLS
jgi:phosphatidate phosphatase APP1